MNKAEVVSHSAHPGCERLLPGALISRICDLLLVAALAACVACGWFGFAFNAAAAFDVFPGLEVTNDGFLYISFESTPNGSEHVDVWLMWILAQTVFPQLIAWQRFSDEFRREQAENVFATDNTDFLGS